MPGFITAGPKRNVYPMNNLDYETVGSAAGLLSHIPVLLNLTLQEINTVYAGRPHCMTDYFEAGTEEKSIEIRFDREEFTLTCVFRPDGFCKCVFLFPDKEETVRLLIAFFTRAYEYDFIKTRWSTGSYYISVQEYDELLIPLCFMFYRAEK